MDRDGGHSSVSSFPSGRKREQRRKPVTPLSDLLPDSERQSLSLFAGCESSSRCLMMMPCPCFPLPTGEQARRPVGIYGVLGVDPAAGTADVEMRTGRGTMEMMEQRFRGSESPSSEKDLRLCFLPIHKTPRDPVFPVLRERKQRQQRSP